MSAKVPANAAAFPGFSEGSERTTGLPGQFFQELLPHIDHLGELKLWRFDFFGAPAPFPPGPFLLAEWAGALLLPSFFLVGADRRFRVVFEEAIDLAGDGQPEARVRAAMSRWLASLERALRAHPEQWYTFYPFWG